MLHKLKINNSGKTEERFLSGNYMANIQKTDLITVYLDKLKKLILIFELTGDL